MEAAEERGSFLRSCTTTVVESPRDDGAGNEVVSVVPRADGQKLEGFDTS